MQKDVAYVVLAPDADELLPDLCSYLRDLSQVYELCRLGKHFPLQLRAPAPHPPLPDFSAGIYSFPFASASASASSASSFSCAPADAGAGIPEYILSSAVFAALPASIREFVHGVGRCFSALFGALCDTRYTSIHCYIQYTEYSTMRDSPLLCCLLCTQLPPIMRGFSQCSCR